MNCPYSGGLPETCDANEKRADNMRCHSRASGSPGLGRGRTEPAPAVILETLDSESKPAPDMIRGPK